MDKIHLSGIRCYGYTGVLPEEQVLGQWFEVDLTLELDLSMASKSDRLEDTLDYRSVIGTVQHIIKTSRFALLERMAAAIAHVILYPSLPSTSPPVQRIWVRLSKLAAPIADFGGTITVEMVRSREL